MNNHMYMVKDSFLVLSMVGKAKAPEHKINTFLLEYDEVQSYYKEPWKILRVIPINVVIVIIFIQGIDIILTMYLNSFNFIYILPIMKKCNKTNKRIHYIYK